MYTSAHRSGTCVDRICNITVDISPVMLLYVQCVYCYLNRSSSSTLRFFACSAILPSASNSNCYAIIMNWAHIVFQFVLHPCSIHCILPLFIPQCISSIQCDYFLSFSVFNSIYRSPFLLFVQNERIALYVGIKKWQAIKEKDGKDVSGKGSSVNTLKRGE